MKRFNFILTLSAVLLLNGCSTPNDAHRADLQDIDLPVMCKAGPDCNDKWRKAQEWVTQHAAYNIPMQTDTVIQTEQPHGLDSRPGFKVTKMLDNADIYRIGFESTCHNWFGCNPGVRELQADFSSYVTFSSADTSKLLLGLRVHPISWAAARKDGLLDATGAVAIVKVLHNSIADRIGLQVGDVILLYDGKPVTTESELQQRVADTLPGQLVMILITRGKEQQTLKIRF